MTLFIVKLFAIVRRFGIFKHQTFIWAFKYVILVYHHKFELPDEGRISKNTKTFTVDKLFNSDYVILFLF